jgi:dihydroneopterin aldolase
VHAEEKLLGGEFEVNIDLMYENKDEVIQHLNETVDYTQVYQIVAERMKKPTPLLETIATELAQLIKQEFTVTKALTIRIKKVNPPIVSFAGNVLVEYHQTY